eukprot:6173187-Pleurochrysis_carterae.AAC.1
MDLPINEDCVHIVKRRECAAVCENLRNCDTTKSGDVAAIQFSEHKAGDDLVQGIDRAAPGCTGCAQLNAARI